MAAPAPAALPLASPAEGIALLAAWKAANPGKVLPNQREIFDGRRLGAWLANRKVEARGSRGAPAAQAAARELLDGPAAEALALEPQWWIGRLPAN